MGKIDSYWISNKTRRAENACRVFLGLAPTTLESAALVQLYPLMPLQDLQILPLDNSLLTLGQLRIEVPDQLAALVDYALADIAESLCLFGYSVRS